jgi:hypothetical protein
MNSIARALNNVAQSLQSIATAILTTKKLDVKPAITSNPASGIIVTKVENYTDRISATSNPPYKLNTSSKLLHISLEERNALDAIYNALKDKGNHPDHHDHIMRELKTKWPVLHKALDSLIIARHKHYSPTSHDYNKTSKNIWNYKNGY